MSDPMFDAKAAIQSDGLYVTNDERSLWIAGHVRVMANGINYSNDACLLTRIEDGWVAVLPAKGMQTYEVPGQLSELVSLIRAIYARHRQAGGELNEAVADLLPDAEQYSGIRRGLTRA